MTDSAEGKTQEYKWRQKPGPVPDRQPGLEKLQIRTTLADNKLIRDTVGKGNLSGFGLFSCLVMLGVFYDSKLAWTRAEQAWTEMLETANQEQLEGIREGLTSLVVMVEDTMAREQ